MMSTMNAVKQKVTGKAKQVEGEINQMRGKGIKGGVQKIQGKIQEKIADVEINSNVKK